MTSDRQGQVTTRVIWHTPPPTPAQLAAWRQLWARLLGTPGLETRQPQDLPSPRATQHDGSDGTDQAVGTASTPPRGECHGAL